MAANGSDGTGRVVLEEGTKMGSYVVSGIFGAQNNPETGEFNSFLNRPIISRPVGREGTPYGRG